MIPTTPCLLNTPERDHSIALNGFHEVRVSALTILTEWFRSYFVFFVFFYIVTVVYKSEFDKKIYNVNYELEDREDVAKRWYEQFLRDCDGSQRKIL